jgi:hypothetical protein
MREIYLVLGNRVCGPARNYSLVIIEIEVLKTVEKSLSDIRLRGSLVPLGGAQLVLSPNLSSRRLYESFERYRQGTVT